MNRDQRLKVINDRQDFYVNRLKELIKEKNPLNKEIFFNSPTGTGKTIMMAKLINECSSFYFVITTLSRGGLNEQVELSLKKRCSNNNYVVYGSSKLKKNTHLQSADVIKNFKNKKVIWLRDEGHIKTNRWTEFLYSTCYRVVNFSATNEKVDLQCNFLDTPMLRTPCQQIGTPEECILKLIEIKNIHQNVPNYNPCLIVRDVSNIYDKIFEDLAKKYNLNIINITDKDSHMLLSLCENDNKYDIIVNKMKITEGIDIPRAHVIFIGNKPNNDATVIQLIGRVRRNALLWMDNIDIFSPKNLNLLNETTKCYVFYSQLGVDIKTSDSGELLMECSDHICLEEIFADKVEVKSNRLINGYFLSELSLLSDTYTGSISINHNGDFAVAENLPLIYQKETKVVHKLGFEFREILKDKELVTLAFDKTVFSRVGKDCRWHIDHSVIGNVKSGKLHRFITNKYAVELDNFEKSLSLMRKINDGFNSVYRNKESLLFTILVPYYLFYLAYGEEYFGPFKKISKHQLDIFGGKYTDLDIILLMLYNYYRQSFIIVNGDFAARFLPKISAENIVEMDENFKIDIKNAATQSYMHLNKDNLLPSYNEIRCPSFGSQQILQGKANLVSKDCIYIFTSNKSLNLNNAYVGLALQFLSKKRFDVNIKKIIFFDFGFKNYITLTITNQNLSTNKMINSSIRNSNYIIENIFNCFSLSSILDFYYKYGHEITLLAIERYKSKLCKLISFTKEDGSTITQAQILSQIDKTHNKEFICGILSWIKPTKDTIKLAIKYQIKEYLNNIDKSKVRVSRQWLLGEAINLENIELAKSLLVESNSSIKDLKEALYTNNPELIDLIKSKLKYSKYDINDVIRTKQIDLIEQLANKYRVNNYNLSVAYKTGNETIIGIIKNHIKK